MHYSTQYYSSGQKFGQQKWVKKGVTWVIQATTSQRNPGCTEKRILVQDQDGGSAQQKWKKKKGVTWVIQATTSQRNPGCTEKRILVQDQDGGNAQHGKERTQHHKHLQKGLSERRGPRAMLYTRKARHTAEVGSAALVKTQRNALLLCLSP
jgi:hypothetical protein